MVVWHKKPPAAGEVVRFLILRLVEMLFIGALALALFTIWYYGDR